MSKNTSHTLGPWRFDGDWYRIPTIYGADGKHVASVEKDKREATPEREANARLIAAAPDLLKACKLAAGVLSGETMHKQGLIDTLESIRAAIKATHPTDNASAAPSEEVKVHDQ